MRGGKIEPWKSWSILSKNGSSATRPKIKQKQREKNAFTLARKTSTACSATKTTGEICAQHTTQSQNRGNSLQQNAYVTIVPPQDTLGKNVVAGGAISVRADTIPAYVISLRGARPQCHSKRIHAFCRGKVPTRHSTAESPGDYILDYILKQLTSWS